MHKYTLYIWIGVWLLVLPFFGLPGTWKETLTVLTGVFLVGHSLLGYRRTRQTETEVEETAEVTGQEEGAPTI